MYRDLKEIPKASGFASPADDHWSGTLDLNQLLLESPASSFFFRVDALRKAEGVILHKDIVLVDRAVSPREGQLVVSIEENTLCLRPFSKDIYELWGVVTWALQKF